MTLKPCGPGKLSFQLAGLSSGGVFPKVVIGQGQDLQKVIEAKARTQRIELDVSSQSVTFMIIDPYNRKIEDRSLLFENLSFLQTEPNSSAINAEGQQSR